LRLGGLAIASLRSEAVPSAGLLSAAQRLGWWHRRWRLWHYAFGGGAVGVHAISGLHRDPAAVDFFQQYFRGSQEMLRR